jgi:hypothetical protein
MMKCLKLIYFGPGISCRAIAIKFVLAGKVPLLRSRPNSSRPSCALRWMITLGRFAAVRRMAVVRPAAIL